MPADFPRFRNGDVEIHLSSSTSHKLVLHKQTLSLHSSWFEASLDERWNPTGGKKVYELRFEKDSSLGLLTERKPTPPADSDFITGSTDTIGMSKEAKRLHHERIAVVKAHEQMFGSMYHMRPALGHGSLDKATASIVQLVQVAHSYGSFDVVKRDIDYHLSIYQSKVLDACFNTPVNMLELAISVESPWIFMEAAAQIIGSRQHDFAVASARLSELPGNVLPLLQKKRSEFIQKLEQCDLRMLSMWGARAGHEHSPAVRIATDAFRKWFSDKLAQGQGSSMIWNYAWVYHEIIFQSIQGTGLEAMVTDHLNSIAYPTPLLDPTWTFNRLREILSAAAEIISPLIESVIIREPKTLQEKWLNLTFMTIGDDELPWVKKG